jgi:hypothetical protein
LQERLLAALQQVPGVRAAGYVNFLPASGARLRSHITVEGLASDESDGAFTVGQRTITPGYLRALSVPLVAGQWCADVRADFGVPKVHDAMLNRRLQSGSPRDRASSGGASRSASWAARSRSSALSATFANDPASPVVPYVRPAPPPAPGSRLRIRRTRSARAGRAIRQLVKSIDPSRRCSA